MVSQYSLHAEDLNKIFLKPENEAKSDFEISHLLHANEQYVEISSTNCLAFNNSLDETFSIMCVNVRSLVNSSNFSKFEGLIFGLSFKPDAICVTETWIQPFSSGQYRNLNGYKFVSNCRKLCKGGGVAMYVKSWIDFNTNDELTVMQEKIFESIFINIRLKSHNILCGTLYRSPTNDTTENDSFLRALKDCVGKLPQNHISYITGDFNYNLANYDNPFISNFTETMFENSFFPVINHPTRITDTSATVLDHIWTNISNHAIKSGIITSPISDHLPVLACTNIESKQKELCENLTKRRKFASRNYARFNTELQHIDIEPVLNETSPNKALCLLITKYSSCFDRCFPLTTVNATGNNNAWYDKELKNLLHVKNKLYKKYLCKKKPC